MNQQWHVRNQLLNFKRFQEFPVVHFYGGGGSRLMIVPENFESVSHRMTWEDGSNANTDTSLFGLLGLHSA